MQCVCATLNAIYAKHIANPELQGRPEPGSSSTSNVEKTCWLSVRKNEWKSYSRATEGVEIVAIIISNIKSLSIELQCA